jgi:hypothetical protein
MTSVMFITNQGHELDSEAEDGPLASVGLRMPFGGF